MLKHSKYLQWLTPIIGILFSVLIAYQIANFEEKTQRTEIETLASNIILKLQDEIEIEGAKLDAAAHTLQIHSSLVNSPQFIEIAKAIVDSDSVIDRLSIFEMEEAIEAQSLKDISLNPNSLDFVYEYPATQDPDTLDTVAKGDIRFTSVTNNAPINLIDNKAVSFIKTKNGKEMVIFRAIRDSKLLDNFGNIDTQPISGYIVGYSSVNESFNSAFMSTAPDWINIFLYTSDKPGSYQQVSEYSTTHESHEKHESLDPRVINADNRYAIFIPGSIDLFGEKLSVLFVPNKSYISHPHPFLEFTTLATFGVGILLTLLSTMYVFSLSERSQKIEALVAQRTDQLDKANESLVEEFSAKEKLLDEFRASQEELSSLINSVDGIVWEKDLETNRYTYVNNQVERILGYSATQVTETEDFFTHKILPDDIEHYKSEYAQHIKDYHSFQIEYGIINANGETKYIRDILTPIHEEERVSKVRGVMLDVTKYKVMAQERAGMEVQLRQSQKLEAVGQLAAGIAHEINTPTQFVGDNVHFLKDAFTDLKALSDLYEKLLETVKDNEQAQAIINEVIECRDEIDVDFLFEDVPNAIEQTLDGTQRISSIVKAMKEFSHPGSTEMETIDLNSAIENTLTVARNEWKYIANMELSLDPELPMVTCLPGEVNQTILNMVVNAAHAIEERNIKEDKKDMGTITLSTSLKDDCVEIIIGDTGNGIPKENLDKVFDPFFTTKEVGKGTGQGLAITYSVIVDKHKGKLDVESEVGKGTRFTINLPINIEDKDTNSEDVAA